MRTTGLLERVLLVLVVCVVITGAAFAQTTFTALSSGDWDTDGRWNQPGAPGSLDTAIIPTGITITLDADASVYNLTLQGTATLDTSGFGLEQTVGGKIIGDVGSTISSSNGLLTLRQISALGTLDISGGNRSEERRGGKECR